MRLLFLGTGAADWVLRERKENEFFRRLTAIRVNDDLMIDCSSDITDFLVNNPSALDNVTDILITHTHGDHYSPDAIKSVFGDRVRVWAEAVAERKYYRICRSLLKVHLKSLKKIL